MKTGTVIQCWLLRSRTNPILEDQLISVNEGMRTLLAFQVLTFLILGHAVKIALLSCSWSKTNNPIYFISYLNCNSVLFHHFFFAHNAHLFLDPKL